MSRWSEFVRLPGVYARLAFWGLLSPIFKETEPLVVVHAVVLRESAGRVEVLLSVRSDVRGWELPGGNPEPGETLEQAVVRELCEETGLVVTIRSRVGDYERTGFRPHLATVYLCRAESGELRPSFETPQVAWWPVGSLPETLFPWFAQPIVDACALEESPYRRRQFQGPTALVSAVWIDLRMRWSQDAGDPGKKGRGTSSTR